MKTVHCDEQQSTALSALHLCTRASASETELILMDLELVIY